MNGHFSCYEITEHSFEENDYLLGMAQNCFLHEKYNDVILIYLCKFFQGPTKQMAAIWKAAREFEIDTFDLEERIITQMLYSTDYVDEIERIYDSYLAGGKGISLYGIPFLFFPLLSGE